MRKGTMVKVKMSKGADRVGKFVGEETNRGTWYIIQPFEKGSVPFKARPSTVTPS